jgi:hypothetical protein
MAGTDSSLLFARRYPRVSHPGPVATAFEEN